MTRRLRFWHPDAFFHVTMRGNNRENIFLTEEDRMQLMRAFEFAYEKYPFTMLAYCIMSNHYHLLIKTEVELSKVMARINRRYSDYYSKRYDHIGRIYQSRYFSKIVDGPQAILAVSSYIHRNPIDTEPPLIERLEDYPYSSYPFYAGSSKIPPRFLDTNQIAPLLPEPFQKNNRAYCTFIHTYKQEEEEENPDLVPVHDTFMKT